MNKPTVRIIQNQQEETKSVKVSEEEARELLLKYSLLNNRSEIPEPKIISTESDVSNNLTFEEMVSINKRRDEDRRKNEQLNKIRKSNEPSPITFGKNRVSHAETKYISDGDTGLDMKINIVTDMKFGK